MNTEKIKNRKGFTLLELLVVVLIIGILAAIALPKYQLATDKAKYTQAMTLLVSINEAQKRYALANGSYTTNFYNLDIEIPPSGIITDKEGTTNGTFEDTWGQCWLHNTGYGACSIKIGKNAYVWYFLHWDGKYFSSNDRQCWVYPKNNERGKRLCKAMTGKDGNEEGSFIKYNFY